MKNYLFTLIMAFYCGLSFAQDLTFDSVAVISPYWGLKLESGSSGDPYMNCGQTNTNFATGQPYLLARFPIRLVNLGYNVAYFGTYGVTPGITHDSCYNNQFTAATDFINIPNFVLASIVDSCGNVIASSRKTDWNIQNNSPYAVSKYNGQWTYLTNYFGTPPTAGSPNICKDWLESLCGPIDTNLAIIGKSQMDSYYNLCQSCDSLVLFPNYASDDYSTIQLPTNLSPGHYKLILAGNFSSYETSNCYPNTISFPFYWNGQTGSSSVYPYFANGITYGQATSCVQISPEAPSNVLAQLNGGSVSVTWSLTNYPQNCTGFVVTPIHVQGNTERVLVGRSITVSQTNASFDAQQLRQDAIALGANNGPAKYRFFVKTLNGGLSSTEVKTRQAINVK